MRRGGGRALSFVGAVLLLLPFFSFLASADSSTELARTSVEELLSELSLILPEDSGVLSPDGSVTVPDGARLFSDLLAVIRGELPSAMKLLLLLVGASVIYSLGSLIGGEGAAAVESALSVILGGGIFAALLPTLIGVSESMASLGELFSALSALLIGAAGLTGGSALAGAGGMGTALSLSFFGWLSGLLLPVTVLLSVLGVLSSVAPDALGGTVGGLRSRLLRALGILTVILGVIFSLQTAIGTAQDGAALRAIKFAASGSIPVVGGAVSGAVSTLAGGVSYAASVIGVGGAIAILSLIMAPLVRILLLRLAFFIAGAIADLLPRGGGGFISALSTGLDLTAAVYSLAAVAYLFETVVLMRSIVGLC